MTLKPEHGTDATRCFHCGGPFDNERVWICGEQYHFGCSILSSPPTVPRWQPIETAPKDGSTVLGFVPAFDQQPVCLIDYSTRYSNWWFLGTECLPTHWMPLPEPPKP
jgi:hypothetical protein